MTHGLTIRDRRLIYAWATQRHRIHHAVLADVFGVSINVIRDIITIEKAYETARATSDPGRREKPAKAKAGYEGRARADGGSADAGDRVSKPAVVVGSERPGQAEQALAGRGEEDGLEAGSRRPALPAAANGSALGHRDEECERLSDGHTGELAKGDGEMRRGVCDSAHGRRGEVGVTPHWRSREELFLERSLTFLYGPERAKAILEGEDEVYNADLETWNRLSGWSEQEAYIKERWGQGLTTTPAPDGDAREREPQQSPIKVTHDHRKRKRGLSQSLLSINSEIPPRVRDILDAVADEFGISVQTLTSTYGTRDATILDAKHEAVVRLRQLNFRGKPPSYPMISRWLGYRDHTTIFYLKKRYAQQLELMQ